MRVCQIGRSYLDCARNKVRVGNKESVRLKDETGLCEEGGWE